MGQKLDIKKMLEISAFHVKEETFEALSLEGENNRMGMSVYQKCAPNQGEDFGLYIHITPNYNKEAVPEELLPLIQLATDNGCDILCLDYEGMQLEHYPTFHW